MALVHDPAIWFLVLALPICVWAAWSDMARMRIPNDAVLALAGIFALGGLVLLPLPEYGLRWLQLGGVLAVGFLANAVRMVGAGDAKFAAAMAPFVAPADWAAFLYLFAAILLGAFALHRTARAVPALRGAAPDWESWRRRDFPMGLALGGALPAYLALVAAGAI